MCRTATCIDHHFLTLFWGGWGKKTNKGKGWFKAYCKKQTYDVKQTNSKGIATINMLNCRTYLGLIMRI